jgi:methionyl aminopeptidase
VTPRLRSSDPCWCGSGRKLKRCHGDHAAYRRPPVTKGRPAPVRDAAAGVTRPGYVADGRVRGGGLQRHDAESAARLRLASRVAAEVLAEIGAAVRAGTTTAELDALAHAAYARRGAYPSTLHYKDYHWSICTSVNEVVCHGIPDDRPLREGDIVNLDVTAFVDGMHGDTSATFAVGELDAPTAALVATTREATDAGIAAVAPGRPLRAIAEAVQSLAFARGFGVVDDVGGHGIGEVFHAAPYVSHVVAGAQQLVLEPGISFTVEPILTAGTSRNHAWDDGWTLATDDLLPSAQFEHTVLVTDTGVEVLTALS